MNHESILPLPETVEEVGTERVIFPKYDSPMPVSKALFSCWSHLKKIPQVTISYRFALSRNAGTNDASHFQIVTYALAGSLIFEKLQFF